MGFFKKIASRLRRQPEITFSAAIVALFADQRRVEEGHFRLAVARSFGVDYPVRVKEDGLRVTLDGIELRAFGVPHPYVPPGSSKERVAAGFKESRFQNAFLDHESFFSIDVLTADVEAGLDAAGRVLAELLDEQTLALVAPDIGAVPFELSMIQELRDGKAHYVLTSRYDGVTPFSPKDKRLQGAVMEARERWPEFETAYRSGLMSAESPGIVKHPFGPKDAIEHMWVEVRAIEGDRIRGVLLNRPMGAIGLKEGMEVEVGASTLTDWVYLGSDGPVGGFAEQVIRGG